MGWEAGRGSVVAGVPRSGGGKVAGGGSDDKAGGVVDGAHLRSSGWANVSPLAAAARTCDQPSARRHGRVQFPYHQHGLLLVALIIGTWQRLQWCQCCASVGPIYEVASCPHEHPSQLAAMPAPMQVSVAMAPQRVEQTKVRAAAQPQTGR